MRREIKTTSTSSATALVSPIVLRETESRRLLFCPTIVTNPHEPDASVRGAFVYQKKGKHDEWVVVKEGTLNDLKKGEGIKLELHSAEVLTLIQGLTEVYELYTQHGLPRGERTFVPVEESLRDLAGIGDDELDQFKELSTDAIRQLITWAISRPDFVDILTALKQLEPEVLAGLSLATGLRVLADAERIWAEHKENGNEEFWQRKLLRNAIFFEQLFSFPIVMVKDRAYVGGKTFENKGGKFTDFLAKNHLTRNAVIIEIKTPRKDLLGDEYRDNVFRPSAELCGAIVQVLDYRRNFTQRVDSLARDADEDIEACEPPCLVIIGNATEELTSAHKRRSFELFRRQLKGVEVVTYDELFEKTTRLLKLGETDVEAAS